MASESLVNRLEAAVSAIRNQLANVILYNLETINITLYWNHESFAEALVPKIGGRVRGGGAAFDDDADEVPENHFILFL